MNAVSPLTTQGGSASYRGQRAIPPRNLTHGGGGGGAACKEVRGATDGCGVFPSNPRRDVLKCCPSALRGARATASAVLQMRGTRPQQPGRLGCPTLHKEECYQRAVCIMGRQQRCCTSETWSSPPRPRPCSGCVAPCSQRRFQRPLLRVLLLCQYNR